MTTQERAYRIVGLGLLVGALVVLASQCSDTEAPAPPSAISIVSGNFQYSLRGTTLPEPLVVKVLTDDGAVPEGARVVFTVVRGGGAASRSPVGIDSRGLASTSYTLGQELGTNVVQAAIEENPSKSVVFEGTSANFFCPEQDDTFRVRYRTPHHLFLLTHKSSLYTAQFSAGVVEVDAIIPGLSTGPFAEVKGQSFDTNVFDAAFSARGDFYVARRSFRSEILKIDPLGNVTFFAHLDEDLPLNRLYVELSMNPSGLLVGCDAKGPFVVGCRDSLTRYPKATYVNGNINHDALAVDPRRQLEDPLGEDIYFIDEASSELKRLAITGSFAVDTTRAPETVASLSRDEAESARGMVCESGQGNVYILVDSDDTKEILEVTPGGAVSVLYNFFERGSGDAAGQQRDLAFDLRNGRQYLYTLDTRNDNILRFEIAQRILTPMFSDSLLQSTLSNRKATGALDGEERVGLVVIGGD
jgi:hypothetical protein